MNILEFANNAVTTLAAGINGAATSATVENGDLFPALSAGQTFKATFVDAETQLVNEIVLVTARTGNVLTIVRAQEGTTARSWLAGDFAAQFNTAGTQADFAQIIKLQSGGYSVATDVSGTANAITADLNTALSTLTDSMPLTFVAAAANIGAVTLNLSLSGTPSGVIPIVKGTNIALASGDIAGDGYTVRLAYNATYDAWVMQNPATQGGGGGIQSVFGRTTPDIVAEDGDYQFAQIDGIPANLIALANLILSANGVLISTGSGALSDLTMAANTFLARASTGNIVAQTITDFTIALFAQTSAPGWRTALGLGTAAVLASDNDGTMSANSATRLPTQQAVVTYVNAKITALFKLIGNWDASGGTYPSTGGSGAAGAILEGNLWIISVAGTLPGPMAVQPGDQIVAVIDTPGQTRANWAFIEGGLGYVPQQQSAALTQISTAGSAGANQFWARAASGILALKTITDNALTFLAAGSVALMRAAIAAIDFTGSQVDNTLVRADGTTNASVQGSGVTLTDADELSGYKANINAQIGTSYAFTADDAGKIVSFNNSGAITVTLPNNLPQGWSATWEQKGTGVVTFSPASGAALHNRQSFTKSAGQWALGIIFIDTNPGGASAVYVLGGDATT